MGRTSAAPYSLAFLTIALMGGPPPGGASVARNTEPKAPEPSFLPSVMSSLA